MGLHNLTEAAQTRLLAETSFFSLLSFSFQTVVTDSLSWCAGPSPNPVSSLEQIIQNMQQIKAAATATTPNPSLNPGPPKPRRAPLPFAPSDPPSGTPGRPPTRLAADSPSALSASHTASKAADMGKQLSSGVTAAETLHGAVQKTPNQHKTSDAPDQREVSGGKSSGALPALPASLAAGDLGGATVQAATPDVIQSVAEEPLDTEHSKETASISGRAVAEDQGMPRDSPAGEGSTEQPDQDVRAAGPSSPTAVGTIKPDRNSDRAKKGNGEELEKKSSRNSEREADRKPSRAKRRRSKSRSPSHSPKR